MEAPPPHILDLLAKNFSKRPEDKLSEGELDTLRALNAKLSPEMWEAWVYLGREERRRRAHARRRAAASASDVFERADRHAVGSGGEVSRGSSMSSRSGSAPGSPTSGRLSGPLQAAPSGSGRGGGKVREEVEEVVSLGSREAKLWGPLSLWDGALSTGGWPRRTVALVDEWLRWWETESAATSGAAPLGEVHLGEVVLVEGEGASRARGRPCPKRQCLRLVPRDEEIVEVARAESSVSTPGNTTAGDVARPVLCLATDETTAFRKWVRALSMACKTAQRNVVLRMQPKRDHHHPVTEAARDWEHSLSRSNSPENLASSAARLHHHGSLSATASPSGSPTGILSGSSRKSLVERQDEFARAHRSKQTRDIHSPTRPSRIDQFFYHAGVAGQSTEDLPPHSTSPTKQQRSPAVVTAGTTVHRLPRAMLAQMGFLDQEQENVEEGAVPNAPHPRVRSRSRSSQRDTSRNPYGPPGAPLPGAEGPRGDSTPPPSRWTGQGRRARREALERLAQPRTRSQSASPSPSAESADEGHHHRDPFDQQSVTSTSSSSRHGHRHRHRHPSKKPNHPPRRARSVDHRSNDAHPPSQHLAARPPRPPHHHHRGDQRAHSVLPRSRHDRSLVRARNTRATASKSPASSSSSKTREAKEDEEDPAGWLSGDVASVARAFAVAASSVEGGQGGHDDDEGPSPSNNYDHLFGQSSSEPSTPVPGPRLESYLRSVTDAARSIREALSVERGDRNSSSSGVLGGGGGDRAPPESSLGGDERESESGFAGGADNAPENDEVEKKLSSSSMAAARDAAVDALEPGLDRSEWSLVTASAEEASVQTRMMRAERLIRELQQAVEAERTMRRAAEQREATIQARYERDRASWQLESDRTTDMLAASRRALQEEREEEEEEEGSTLRLGTVEGQRRPTVAVSRKMRATIHLASRTVGRARVTVLELKLLLESSFARVDAFLGAAARAIGEAARRQREEQQLQKTGGVDSAENILDKSSPPPNHQGVAVADGPDENLAVETWALVAEGSGARVVAAERESGGSVGSTGMVRLCGVTRGNGSVRLDWASGLALEEALSRRGVAVRVMQGEAVGVVCVGPTFDRKLRSAQRAVLRVVEDVLGSVNACVTELHSRQGSVRRHVRGGHDAENAAADAAALAGASAAFAPSLRPAAQQVLRGLVPFFLSQEKERLASESLTSSGYGGTPTKSKTSSSSGLYVSIGALLVAPTGVADLFAADFDQVGVRFDVPPARLAVVGVDGRAVSSSASTPALALSRASLGSSSVPASPQTPAGPAASSDSAAARQQTRASSHHRRPRPVRVLAGGNRVTVSTGEEAARAIALAARRARACLLGGEDGARGVRPGGSRGAPVSVAAWLRFAHVVFLVDVCARPPRDAAVGLGALASASDARLEQDVVGSAATTPKKDINSDEFPATWGRLAVAAVGDTADPTARARPASWTTEDWAEMRSVGMAAHGWAASERAALERAAAAAVLGPGSHLRRDAGALASLLADVLAQTAQYEPETNFGSLPSQNSSSRPPALISPLTVIADVPDAPNCVHGQFYDRLSTGPAARDAGARAVATSVSPSRHRSSTTPSASQASDDGATQRDIHAALRTVAAFRDALRLRRPSPTSAPTPTPTRPSSFAASPPSNATPKPSSPMGQLQNAQDSDMSDDGGSDLDEDVGPTPRPTIPQQQSQYSASTQDTQKTRVRRGSGIRSPAGGWSRPK